MNKQLFQELDDKAAENCNGGVEVFTIRNQAKRVTAGYSIDGRNARLPYGKQQIWTTRRGGTIVFDRDTRKSVNAWTRYNLAGGKLYAFRWNASTRGNPYDIGLYKIG